eukprot:876277-Prymnesium_polylepis.2
MLAPFEALGATWPTIFRLPLRSEPSEFGAIKSLRETETLLAGFQSSAQEALVFSKHLRRA